MDDIPKVKQITVLADDVREDITAVLNYLWYDEALHYEEFKENEPESTGHIFETLQRLAKVVDFKY